VVRIEYGSKKSTSEMRSAMAAEAAMLSSVEGDARV